MCSAGCVLRAARSMRTSTDCPDREVRQREVAGGPGHDESGVVVSRRDDLVTVDPSAVGRQSPVLRME
ncbi:hypothetical protein ABZ621_35740 [Streptomyces sp. NPDC007863]|uniref:hypothetical protein n=1 Tax=Streptomyces sp. NPDC007863 TaxID=3154894 RepID=UPI0033C28836